MRPLTAVGDAAVNAQLLARTAPATPEPPEPLPSPEVAWRIASAAEMGSCKAASRLEALAFDAGWFVAPHFARGSYIGANGQSLGLADGLALLFGWPDLQAVGIWYRRDAGWKFGFARIQGTSLTATELRHWLVGP